MNIDWAVTIDGLRRGKDTLNIKSNLPNTIREPELKLLLSAVPDLSLRFEEIPLVFHESNTKDLLEREIIRPPEGIPIPKKLLGKLEQFFCIIEVPGQLRRYLITQKGQLRVMSAHACARLCKEVKIPRLTLNLNNPLHLPLEKQ